MFPASSASADHIVLARASVDNIKIENKVNTNNHPSQKIWNFGVLADLDSGTEVGKPAPPPSLPKKYGTLGFRQIWTWEQKS